MAMARRSTKNAGPFARWNEPARRNSQCEEVVPDVEYCTHEGQHEVGNFRYGNTMPDRRITHEENVRTREVPGISEGNSTFQRQTVSPSIIRPMHVLDAAMMRPPRVNPPSRPTQRISGRARFQEEFNSFLSDPIRRTDPVSDKGKGKMQFPEGLHRKDRVSQLHTEEQHGAYVEDKCRPPNQNHIGSNSLQERLQPCRSVFMTSRSENAHPGRTEGESDAYWGVVGDLAQHRVLLRGGTSVLTTNNDASYQNSPAQLEHKQFQVSQGKWNLQKQLPFILYGEDNGDNCEYISDDEDMIQVHEEEGLGKEVGGNDKDIEVHVVQSESETVKRRERRHAKSAREKEAARRSREGLPRNELLVNARNNVSFGYRVTEWRQDIALLSRTLDPAIGDIRRQPEAACREIEEWIQHTWAYTAPVSFKCVKKAIARGVTRRRAELWAMISEKKPKPNDISDRTWRSLAEELQNPKTVKRRIDCGNANASRINFGRTGPSGEIGVCRRLEAKYRRAPHPHEIQAEMTRDKGYGGKSKKKKVSDNVMHGSAKAFTAVAELHMVQRQAGSVDEVEKNEIPTNESVQEACNIVGGEGGISETVSCAHEESTGGEPKSKDHLAAIEMVKTLQAKVDAMEQMNRSSRVTEDLISDQTEFQVVSNMFSKEVFDGSAEVPKEGSLVSAEAEVQPAKAVQQPMTTGENFMVSENVIKPISESLQRVVDLEQNKEVMVGRQDLIHGGVKATRPRGRPRKKPKCT